jgi:tRNA A37 N6-isopentenylltransferase MiaA
MAARIQAAPGLHGCCDAAGRLVLLAYQPTTRAHLVALAIARGEGSREEIEQRVHDMLAAGMLIEIEE